MDREEIVAQIADLQQRIDALNAMLWPKKAKLYLHADSENNHEIAEEIGLSEKATETFHYACYEVEMDVLINQDGTAVLTHVGKIPLNTPLKVA
jgi:hypothetical protein